MYRALQLFCGVHEKLVSLALTEFLQVQLLRNLLVDLLDALFVELDLLDDCFEQDVPVGGAEDGVDGISNFTCHRARLALHLRAWVRDCARPCLSIWHVIHGV